ncbi:hypothetical protein AZG88_20845 [Rhodococcus sp. LB1]|nr:hypothetical protein AZG88_20845 [Rhodococcus sp. LB1]
MAMASGHHFGPEFEEGTDNADSVDIQNMLPPLERDLLQRAGYRGACMAPDDVGLAHHLGRLTVQVCEILCSGGVAGDRERAPPEALDLGRNRLGCGLVDVGDDDITTGARER